jgi:hypothetical protein
MRSPMRVWWSAALVAALAVLGGCAGDGGGRAPVAYDVEPWNFGHATGYTILTPHYEIRTTIQDPTLREALPDFVEAAYGQYQALIPIAAAPEKRMRIYLFASRAQWEAFTKRFTGSRSKLYLQVRNGGFAARGVSVIEYVTHAVTFPLFAHEGFHQYLQHHTNARIPAWLNEGLAVYCEGQRWGTMRLKRFDPAFNPGRAGPLRAALASNRLMSLRALLETNPGRVIQGSSAGVATYYSQVWGLVLFLRTGEDGKYAERFDRLLEHVPDLDIEQFARAAHIWSSRQSFNYGEALFRNFISEDIDAVEQEYFAFLRERFLDR